MGQGKKMGGFNLSCTLKKVKGRGTRSGKGEQLEAKKAGSGESRGRLMIQIKYWINTTKQ